MIGGHSITEAELRGRYLHLQKHNLDGILGTPREAISDRSSYIAEADFRFRGYPSEGFEHPRSNLNTSRTSDVSPSNHLPDNDKAPQLDRDDSKCPEQVTQCEELVTFREKQEERDRQIQEYKKEKRARMERDVHQQRQDMEMLKNYHPWGRPGGGAPNKAPLRPHRMRGLLHDSQLNSPRSQPTDREQEMLEEYGDFHDKFGRPGAGAPLRTESGRIKTELRGDSDIRFLDTEKGRDVFDKEVRYRRPGIEKHQYAEELASPDTSQVESKIQRSKEERLENLRRELEMSRHNPYGRPGAGAPNKTRSESDLHFNKSGNYNGVAMSVMGGGGSPRMTPSGHVTARYPTTMVHDHRGGVPQPAPDDPGAAMVLDKHKSHTLINDDDPELQIYDPWGKVGCGAPLKDRHGKVMTQVFGKIEKDGATFEKKKPAAAQGYLTELQREIHEQKQTRDALNSLGRAEAGEFVGIMKEGKVGKPRRDPLTGDLTSQHLPSTDVTQEVTDTRHLKTSDSPLYRTELERAAVQRKRNQRLDKLKEQQEGKHHQDAFKSMWGRPGAGAPNLGGNKLANFEQTLNSPRAKPVDYYSKQDQPRDHRPDKYVRSTVNSKAENRYDFHRPQRREAKVNYDLETPWATSPHEVF